MCRRPLEERSLIRIGPDFLGARAAIKPPATGAWIGGDKSAIHAPRQDAGEHHPCIIGLPAGCDGEMLAPALKIPRVRLSVIADSGKSPNSFSMSLILPT